MSAIVIDTPAQSPLMRPTNLNAPVFSPTAALDPAMLTPSAESERLGDVLMKISADLPCQEYEWSSIVVVDATEARFECSNTNRENKNTIYISFRRGRYLLGFECFHGYIASSYESSYPIVEHGDNGKVLDSSTHHDRLFTWVAQGIIFTIVELIEGNQNATLASPDLPEKIYVSVMHFGLITSEGDDCTQ